jgi:GalNAc-alpha-(1->4)-GalNAc-alpha-(1->3)-diNAcBac-PP-undecaprenol alpha-1,4-N-acetyl-D-galactosaminyltransferase
VSKEHQVTLVTLASPDAKPFYPLDSKIHLIQLNQTQNESSFVTRLGNILRRVFCLRTALKTLNPDAALSFVDVMNLTTLLASAGLNIPVIASERTHPFYHKLPSIYTSFEDHFISKIFSSGGANAIGS